jgi:hypothetical protein
MTLTYLRLATDRGSLLLPNSTILTAVIGPPGSFDEDQPPPWPMAPGGPAPASSPAPSHAPNSTAPTSTEPPTPHGVAQQP